MPITMNHQPPPPARRIVLLRTTTDILKQTTSIFSTQNNLLTLLFLSFVLLSERLIVEKAALALTSYIDNQPSLKSYYQIHRPPNPTAITTTRRHRHRPSVELTRDDDFISGHDKLDRRFFCSLHKPQLNSTSSTLDSFDPQFFNFVSDDGIRASETIPSTATTTFRPVGIIEKEENVAIDEINDSVPINQTDSPNFTALLSIMATSSLSYGLVFSGSVVTHSLIHVVIFLLVLNDFCTRYNDSVTTYVNGCLVGFHRSFDYIVVISLIRIVSTQILGDLFFGGIEDQYYSDKIFVWLLFMPYSIFTPWVKGFEKESHGFILSWLILDMLLSFVLSVHVWVVMAYPRKNWIEVVKEGVHLLSLMIFPAIKLKCLEGIVCGPFARWLLARTFGDVFAIAFQAFMEVYFMAAWMVYYLSVKSIDANSRGQPFGQRELEAMIVDLDSYRHRSGNLLVIWFRNEFQQMKVAFIEL